MHYRGKIRIWNALNEQWKEIFWINGATVYTATDILTSDDGLRRVRWFKGNLPAHLQKLYAVELCNLYSGAIPKERDINHFWFFSCNLVSHTLQLLTLQLSVDGLISFHHFPVNHVIYIPSQILHRPWAYFDAGQALSEIVELHISVSIFCVSRSSTDTIPHLPYALYSANQNGASWRVVSCRHPSNIDSQIWLYPTDTSNLLSLPIPYKRFKKAETILLKISRAVRCGSASTQPHKCLL